MNAYGIDSKDIRIKDFGRGVFGSYICSTEVNIERKKRLTVCIVSFVIRCSCVSNGLNQVNIRHFQLLASEISDVLVVIGLDIVHAILGS